MLRTTATTTRAPYGQIPIRDDCAANGVPTTLMMREINARGTVNSTGLSNWVWAAKATVNHATESPTETATQRRFNNLLPPDLCQAIPQTAPNPIAMKPMLAKLNRISSGELSGSEINTATIAATEPAPRPA